MSLKHHFLIAMPGLQNPFFKQSVIYICKHDKNGAMGIVINKPIENLTIKKILNKLNINIPPNDYINNLNKSVIIGGPISEDRGFILHSFKKKFVSSILISKNVFITSSRDVLEYIANHTKSNNILMTLGHCIWQKNQLENEILDNIWLTASANNNILFNTPLSERWIESARNIGVDIFRLTTNFGHA
ncbi:YqgE/AlgH family protein [Buchnera aphidicola]|uniref:YqgE/AlgH family protein n=1 Tax=Buchnera aphidicola TaxID=9 RepID=UPI0016517F1C|nr:YqgE/AlgH family protein [Buchnera aphidicola]